jgi:hypothetical protein
MIVFVCSKAINEIYPSIASDRELKIKTTLNVPKHVWGTNRCSDLSAIHWKGNAVRSSQFTAFQAVGLVCIRHISYKYTHICRRRILPQTEHCNFSWDPLLAPTWDPLLAVLSLGKYVGTHFFGPKTAPIFLDIYWNVVNTNGFRYICHLPKTNEHLSRGFRVFLKCC